MKPSESFNLAVSESQTLVVLWQPWTRLRGITGLNVSASPASIHIPSFLLLFHSSQCCSSVQIPNSESQVAQAAWLATNRQVAAPGNPYICVCFRSYYTVNSILEVLSTEHTNIHTYIQTTIPYHTITFPYLTLRYVTLLYVTLRYIHTNIPTYLPTHLPTHLRTYHNIT